MDLKQVSLGVGGTPKPIAAYPDTPRPDKMAAPTQVPRDNGGLSDGTTGGNCAPLKGISK